MEVQKYSDDFSQEEKEALQDYIKNGCPSLVTVTESKVFEWFELYMSGKSYSEIANITSSKRDLILYISYKSKWHESRSSYIASLSANLASKITQTKLESLNTVQTIVSALGKSIEGKMNTYLKTKDEGLMAQVSKDDLRNYFKGLEVFEKLVSEPKEGGGKGVTINIGTDSTITQKDENVVEVSTASSAEKLRKLAEEKRQKKIDEN
jgi:hypothetical protein